MSHKTDKEQLGRLLHKRRKELKLSVRDLRTMVGQDNAFFKNIEEGVGNPTLNNLLVLFDALEMDFVMPERQE